MAFVEAFANVVGLDTDDGLVIVDAGGPLHAQPSTTRSARWTDGALAHGRVHPRPRRPHLRRGAVRGRGADDGWRPTSIGARGAARPLRPLRDDERLQRRHQPAAVPAAGADFPGDYRYPDETYRDALDVDRRRRSTSSCATTAARPTTTPGCGCPSAQVAVHRRPVHLGRPNCGNPQKVQRYPRRVGGALRAMADARRRAPAARPRPAHRRRRPDPHGRSPRPPSCSSRCRPDHRAHERGRPARRDHPHRARARRSAGPALAAARLRRARVRRAQHLAAVRRLVRRRTRPTSSPRRTTAVARGGRRALAGGADRRGLDCWTRNSTRRSPPANTATATVASTRLRTTRPLGVT